MVYELRGCVVGMLGSCLTDLELKITRGYPLESTRSHDIIILGSGIAGLLIGSELSKWHDVVLVEKEAKIPDRKYWLTSEKCLHLNPELQRYIDSRYTHMDFIGYNGTSYRCFGNYILWNTDALLRHLSGLVESNGGKILRGHQFFSFHYVKGGISVEVNDLELKAKLLVDCMGFSSPIIYAKDIVRIRGYYFIYGSAIRLREPIQPICLANVMINARPKYLEVFPTSSNDAYATILAPSESIKPPENMQKDFEFIVKQSKYKRYFSPDSGRGRVLCGIVPVGQLKKRSLDRIVFYGEAGQVHPAATGTGLTKMLMNYKQKSEFLSSRLNNAGLSEADLDETESYSDRYNRKFQLSLFDQVLRWDSDLFIDLLSKMEKMDTSIINNVLFGELKIAEMFDGRRILDLLRTRNHFMLKPLLRAFLP